MATIAIQSLNVNAKKELAYTAVAAGGDKFVPATTDQKLLLHFKNTNVAARTVTINDVNSVAPPGAKTFDADIDIVVDATDECFVELDGLGRFINADGTGIAMTYSADADLSVAIARLA